MSDENKNGEKQLSADEALAVSLRARYGDPDKALRVLAKENFKLREKVREYREKSPAEGAVVLNAEDAKLFSEFKAIGLKPEEVTGKLTDLEKAQKALSDAARNEVTREAAEALNFKPSVLIDLVTSKGLVIEMRETKVTAEDGTESSQKQPYVKVGDAANHKHELLKAFVERNLKDYLPALNSTTDGGGGVGDVHYPEQRPGGPAAKPDVLGRVLGSYVTPSQRNAAT